MILKAFEYHTKMDLKFLGVFSDNEQIIKVILGKCPTT